MTEILNEAAADTGRPQDAPRRAAVNPMSRDDFDRDVWCLLGLPFDLLNIDAAAQEIDAAVRDGRRLSFVTPNVNIMVRALNDPAARGEILNADLSLIDGAPLVQLARLLGAPAIGRVAGSDLFEALRRRSANLDRPLKVFLFGGRDGAAEAAAEALNQTPGGVIAVGALNPGFGDLESMSADAIIEQINAAAPDFVLVALGYAKGQAWIERNRERLNAPVTAHLGAVIDFTAGGIARAPVWMQRSGLEWAWRIKEEPSLWRRYIEDARSLVGVLFAQVLPQWRLGRHATGGTPCSADLIAAPDHTEIKIAGDAVRGGLREPREAFRKAAARGLPVRLDLIAIGRLDRAFLGLLLMLEKNLKYGAAGISIAGADEATQRLLVANRMNYGAADALASGAL